MKKPTIAPPARAPSDSSKVEGIALSLTIDGHGDMCHEALVTNMAAGNEAMVAGGG